MIYGFVHTLDSKHLCFFFTVGRSCVCAPHGCILTVLLGFNMIPIKETSHAVR